MLTCATEHRSLCVAGCRRERWVGAFVGRLLALGVAAIALGAVRSTQGLELTGVMLYAADRNGNPTGDVWRTTSGRDGYPLALSWSNPVGVSTYFLRNAENYEINIPLNRGHTVIHTVLWQYPPRAFPPYLVLNLFFDGDNLRPRISVLVPYARGFTHFRGNPAPVTYGLYRREVENDAGVSFVEDGLEVRLGVAFYTPSAGGTIQWALTDFFDVDRVGFHAIEPDGNPDGILVYELVTREVQPDPTPTAPPAEPERPVAGPPAEPMRAFVGPDLWVPEPRDAAEVLSETSPPGSTVVPEWAHTAVAAQTATPPPATRLVGGAPATPTPAGSSDSSPGVTPTETPGSPARTPDGTPTPVLSPPAGAASTPVPPAGSGSPTPRPPWWRR